MRQSRLNQPASSRVDSSCQPNQINATAVRVLRQSLELAAIGTALIATEECLCLGELIAWNILVTSQVQGPGECSALFTASRTFIYLR